MRGRRPTVRPRRGRYVYVDYCSGRVRSIPATLVVTGREGPAGPGATSRLEPVTVASPVSFGLDGQGELLVVSLGGTISRFVP